MKKLLNPKKHKLLIRAFTKQKDQMRYATCGDWQTNKFDNVWSIDITNLDTKNSDFDFLLIIHELIEAYLCLKRGISETVVDNWDFKVQMDEAGDDQKAPYHKEHMFASKIEQLICEELGYDFGDYDHQIDKIYDKAFPNTKK